MCMKVRVRKTHVFQMIFIDFMRIMKQIGITLGHFEITLGLLWVYEDHFGSLWDHFGMTWGSVGVILGI